MHTKPILPRISCSVFVCNGLLKCRCWAARAMPMRDATIGMMCVGMVDHCSKVFFSIPVGGLQVTFPLPTSFQLVDRTVPPDSCNVLHDNSSTTQDIIHTKRAPEPGTSNPLQHAKRDSEHAQASCRPAEDTMSCISALSKRAGKHRLEGLVHGVTAVLAT